MACQKVRQGVRSPCVGSQSVLRRERPELQIASNSYQGEDTAWATDSTLTGKEGRWLTARGTSP